MLFFVVRTFLWKIIIKATHILRFLKARVKNVIINKKSTRRLKIPQALLLNYWLFNNRVKHINYNSSATDATIQISTVSTLLPVVHECMTDIYEELLAQQKSYFRRTLQEQPLYDLTFAVTYNNSRSTDIFVRNSLDCTQNTLKICQYSLLRYRCGRTKMNVSGLQNFWVFSLRVLD